MAPLAATLTNAAFELIARQLGAGNKSPQQYAAQGRYSYVPSFGASVLFTILFVLVTLANVFLFFRHRSWFWWSMNLAVIMELVGYVARDVSIKSLDNRTIFIIQTVFLLVAPAVYAAACYQAFGRIVLWVVPPQYQTAKHLWLPSRYITPLFVGFDVFAFFVQVVGGSMLAGANTSSKQTTGKNVILVGLVIQMITFGFFVLASVRFSFFLRSTLREVPLPAERNWRLFLQIINIASVLILIRTISRFIEFVIGVNSYLSDHEWYFYVFDATLMWLVSFAFVICHPGYFLPYLGMRRKHKEFSRHAQGGFASRFARGTTRIAIPGEELSARGMDMSREY